MKHQETSNVIAAEFSLHDFAKYAILSFLYAT